MMDLDFEMILTLLTVLSGLVWLVDALLFARKRHQKQRSEMTDTAAQVVKKRRDPVLVEYCRSFFPVLLIVLLLRSFLVEPFHIPSPSMVPTLLVGDFILVNKFNYGLRLPVSHTKIVSVGEPRRGDVVVFHFPAKSATEYCASQSFCDMGEIQRSTGTDFIKRVVGLPGDHIVYRGEGLYINGVQVPDQALGLYNGPDLMGAVLHRETLGNTGYDTLILPGQPHRQGQWTVPPGEYFVMGDNRDDSWDSRYWGFVPEKNLVGRAFFIWMNWDAVLHPFHHAALWHRFGKVIH